MAVAVKQGPEATRTRTPNRLALGSLAGMAYVVVSLALIFHGLNYLWWNIFDLDADNFANWSILILAMIGLAAGLYALGMRLVGPSPPHGLRAGVFTALVFLIFDVLVVQGVGVTIENMVGTDSVVGMAVWVVVSLGVIFFTFRSFFRAGFEKWLVRFEDQGWFTRAAYKGSQGLRVRRGTILGVLALAACGIYTMLTHNPLVGDWELEVPFVDNEVFVLLPYVRYTLTLLLAAGSIWFAWRLVNFPTFADFLIATEAEMNKVSWTTRRRLIQDTIVVLTTVFLMTLFLLIVDVLWFKILSNPLIKVLSIDTTATQTAKQAESPDW